MLENLKVFASVVPLKSRWVRLFGESEFRSHRKIITYHLRLPSYLSWKETHGRDCPNHVVCSIVLI